MSVAPERRPASPPGVAPPPLSDLFKTLSGRSHQALAEAVARYHHDPLGFVLAMFPWGQPETALARETGPDAWQRDLLTSIGEDTAKNRFDGLTPVTPIRRAVASGHGVGKTVLVAWLTLWILSTRPHSQGTLTANTFTQLRDKTWAALKFWHSLCYTMSWFTMQSDRILHVTHAASWFAAAQSCRVENSEAYAGQHSKKGTSFYIFDEACHDDRTQVLTDRGWQWFRDLRPSDACLTMDPSTGRAEYLAVRRVHLVPFDGELVTAHRRGLNFAVTPSHQMLVRRRRGYARVEARYLRTGLRMLRNVAWEVPDASVWVIPEYQATRRFYPARRVLFDPWMVLLGWYASEGHLTTRKNRRGEIEHIGVGVTNTNASHRAAVVAAALACGLRAKDYGKTVMISDRACAEYLARFGVGALVKGVPDELRSASRRQLNLFLDAAVAGDGYVKQAGPGARIEALYTSSERLAGDYQEICVKAGWHSTVTQRGLTGVESKIAGRVVRSTTDGFVVTRSSADTDVSLRARDLHRTAYRGWVYCAELLRHHLLLTRRDGSVLWSGNSAIPDRIYEVAEGGLTDGEPMMFLFGNPTKNSGTFHTRVFGAGRDLWRGRSIDARTSRFTNKQTIRDWATEWGEDSDFFRVRVRGLPPRANELQLIDQDRIWAAQRRVAITLPQEPLIAGVDVSGGGKSWNVIRFRRGNDARTIPPIRIAGTLTSDGDRTLFTTTLANVLTQHPVAMMFVDSAFGSPYVERLKALGFGNVREVNFGAPSPDAHQANMRAYMWQKMKDWLVIGMLPEKDVRLESDLSAPGYHLNTRNALVLESKKSLQARNVDSPDDADALAATFAAPVVGQPNRLVELLRPEPRGTWQV